MGCKSSKFANSISNAKESLLQKNLERSFEIEEVRIEVIPKPNIINNLVELTTITEGMIGTRPMVGKATKSDQDKITHEVHDALVKFLPGYKVDPFKDKFGNDLFYSPSFGVMDVLKNPKISINPELTGTSLRYSIISTDYTLHACFMKGNPSKVKFLYQLTTPKETFVTSPFHPGPSNSVPCSHISIEEALKETDPVAGIVEALGKIRSNNTEKNGFDGIDFVWDMNGHQNDFSISMKLKEEEYWEDVDGHEGEVKTTNLVANQLHLIFKDFNNS